MIVLIPVLAFATSTITAVFGLGGGIILIALMRELGFIDVAGDE